MYHLSSVTLKKYREKTFRSRQDNRLHTLEEAIEFVNQRGFIFFWPIQQVILPSLWTAVAGDRPVANQHDDPGHITWGWKDQLLGKKVWYYAKILYRRNTLISLNLLPYFFALSPNFGDPYQDYMDQYHNGSLTLEAKQVYEALLREGPMDTISLRKAARLSSSESTSRFTRALDTLQMEFKVLPVGVARTGAWHYAFVYDLVHRHYPELIDQTRSISENQARYKILLTYFESVGAANLMEMQRIFPWQKEDLQRTLQALAHVNMIQTEVELENPKQSVFALSSILFNDV
ncbi:MAG: crosslink repair DNA glycosylase YcaQ family protein [Chloroflexota bacterium]